MKFRLFIATNVLLLLTISELNAQWQRYEYRDRLGDSIILKDMSEEPPRQKGPPPLTGEFSVGPLLLSDGYGLQLSYGRYFGVEEFGQKDFDVYYNTHVVQLTFSERFHPKEYRDLLGSTLKNVVSEDGSGLPVYGKVNNFYNINLSYGQRRLFGGKGEQNAVLVQFFYSGGINVGLIKPYYIETSLGMIKYSEPLRDYFLDQNQISGKGGYKTGWNELSTNFGVSLKGGVHLDFAKRRKSINALEIGVGFDYYFNKVHQMVTLDEKNAFLNIYLTYQIGKRR